MSDSGDGREPLDVVHFGLGPIGRLIATEVARRPDLKSVAAIDISPALVGLDLGEVCGLGHLGVTLESDARSALKDRGSVVFHSTVSSLADAWPQIRDCVRTGKQLVISTCEELAFPWRRHTRLAQEIDAEAKEHGTVVLGTGVNPGFAMDFLPIVLSGSSMNVESVSVIRLQNIITRRARLLEKLGIGMDLEQHRRTQDLGHVGLTESAHAIASALGWRITAIKERIKPTVAEQEINTPVGPVREGSVSGISQRLVAFSGNREAIRMRLDLSVDVAEPIDEVVVSGEPGLRALIPGGISGDVATAALAVNSVGVGISAEAGLRVMSELPPPRPGPLVLGPHRRP